MRFPVSIQFPRDSLNILLTSWKAPKGAAFAEAYISTHHFSLAYDAI